VVQVEVEIINAGYKPVFSEIKEKA
jgi:hypothetical protein